jgi:hypothetical protein
MADEGNRLKPEARPGPDPNWFKHHAIGLITLVIGVAGFVVVALNQQDFWQQPDHRLTVPFLVATVAGAVVSISRKEGAVALPLLGVGAAGAAMVLGFVIVFGIVLAATAIVILIMSHTM